jgi:hypothetical protein
LHREAPQRAEAEIQRLRASPSIASPAAHRARPIHLLPPCWLRSGSVRSEPRDGSDASAAERGCFCVAMAERAKRRV